MNGYVCIKSICIYYKDFSSSLAIEMYGQPFIFVPPYMEYNRVYVLSDYT